MSDIEKPEWYYGSGAMPKGPFTRSQIHALAHAGSVTAETLVWSAGMPGWTPLQNSTIAALVAAAAPIHHPGGVHGFADAISAGFAKYAAFRGRATRTEYWFFYLFTLLAQLSAMLLDIGLTGQPGPFQLLTSLGLTLPTLAAASRRLHDTDRSAWWILIVLVPIVGIIALIVFLSQRSTQGPNRFD